MTRFAPFLLVLFLTAPVLAASTGPPAGDEIDALTVRAVIRIGSDTVTAESLQSRSQAFEGTVRDGLIRGTFTIGTRAYDGEGAPPALTPAPGEPDPVPDEVKPHLLPDDEIDSDEKAIEATVRRVLGLSSFLGAFRLATDLRYCVARCVEPGPRRGKASEAPAARSADAHGSALLLAALCRAASIPARLASGAAVTDLAAGAAVPHTWVEVWMGSAGWVPLDPSPDASEILPAGILRIATGPVDVEVLEIEILDFRPRTARPPPFVSGRTYFYDHLVDGRRAERCEFRIDEEAGGFRLSVETELTSGATRTSVLQTDRFLRPLRFGLRAEGESGSTTEKATFRDGRAFVTRAPAGGKRYQAAFDSGRDCYLIFADSEPCWALIVSQIPLDKGEVRVETCVTTASQPMTVKLRPGAIGEIDLDGRKVMAREVGVLVGCKSMTFRVTPDGRLVRIEEGARTIVLREGRTR